VDSVTCLPKFPILNLLPESTYPPKLPTTPTPSLITIDCTIPSYYTYGDYDPFASNNPNIGYWENTADWPRTYQYTSAHNYQGLHPPAPVYQSNQQVQASMCCYGQTVSIAFPNSHSYLTTDSVSSPAYLEFKAPTPTMDTAMLHPKHLQLVCHTVLHIPAVPSPLLTTASLTSTIPTRQHHALIGITIKPPQLPPSQPTPPSTRCPSPLTCSPERPRLRWTCRTLSSLGATSM
jgi:hypothetical protein